MTIGLSEGRTARSGTPPILPRRCPRSTSAPTPSRCPPTRCAGRWPRPRSATTCSREDPTVNALEERAAELLGKEAGLFVTSGTQGNLVSLMGHLARGQEAIGGRQHHLVIDEAAGHAVVVGASIRQLAERPDGTLDPDEVDGGVPRSERSARAADRAGHPREHPRPLDGPAARRRRTPPGSPGSPTTTASRSTSTAPASSTRSSPSGRRRVSSPPRPTR